MQYPSVDDVVALHQATLETMGGGSRPLLQPGALDSALHRPQLAAHYEGADLATQAALLVGGIAMAHAFEDGNKRTALMVGDVFIHSNGWWIFAEPLAFAKQIEALVMRPDSELEATARLAAWIRERLRPLGETGTFVEDGDYYDLPIDVTDPEVRQAMLDLVAQSQQEEPVTLALGNMPLFGGVRLFILSEPQPGTMIIRAFARNSTLRPQTRPTSSEE